MKKATGPELAEKQKAEKIARQKMDAYNRYTIAVRGASADIYGILGTTNIETAFANLLQITMPPPTVEDEVPVCQHIERLVGYESGHTAWMLEYSGAFDDMDVDAIDV